MRRILFALAITCAAVNVAAAQPQFQEGGQVSCDQRYLNTCDKRGWDKGVRAVKKAAPFRHRRAHVPRRARAVHAAMAQALDRRTRPAEILPHPAGCPRRAFCGCGAAVKIFGAPIRALWLAANWFRYPPAEPAPGMVAVRRHHVFVIEKVIDRRHVIAWDANSGGHQTRRHVRSLAGYSIRNPHGGRA